MSYSAFVICNCYKDGKTEDPPYKEFVQFDEDSLNLNIPDKIEGKRPKNTYQMYGEFDKWIQTACEHKDMELAYEYLSNNSGMSAFRHIIKKLNINGKYSVLAKYLPTANGGILPAQFASQALDELALLEKEPFLEETVVLSEKSTSYVIASVNTDTYWLFVFSGPKYSYGIDKDGFFILEYVEENGKEVSYLVFRSMNFIQQKVSDDNYMFIDIPTGKRFTHSISLYIPNQRNEVGNSYEYEVKITHISVANEYSYMIEPLRRLAEASVDSGNPIHWT